jgi:hypothetical protein
MGKKAKNLSEEQVSQIAERIGAQQKQVSARDGANRSGRMSAYLVGALPDSYSLSQRRFCAP